MTVTAACDLALRIVSTLRVHGHEAYFVGGCVRDQLMKLQPLDYDVATSATSDEVEALFDRTFAVGKAFGVVIVVHETYSNVQVEVATFRSDGVYLDGRRPQSVTFGDARTDAQRRDFTINGIFYDPQTKEYFDYVGGQADLRNRTIRAIGDASSRFEEDKLRMLRGIRFACRFNFVIEEETWRATCATAPKLREVSWERIRFELEGILSYPGRGRAFGLMLDSGILEVILPELVELAFDRPQVYARSLGMLDALGEPDLAAARRLGETEAPWLMLLHGLKTEQVRAILNLLAMPKAFITLVCNAHAIAPQIAQAPSLRVAELKRFLRRPETALAIQLEKTLCAFQAGNHEGLSYCLRYLREVEEQRQKGFEPLNPPIPINGDDLAKLGIPPGRHYRDILGGVEDAILEGEVASRDEALQLALQLWQPPT